MKLIRLYVTEQISSEQVFEVDDDFDLDDNPRLHGLWKIFGDIDGSFVSVDERHISAEIEQETEMEETE